MKTMLAEQDETFGYKTVYQLKAAAESVGMSLFICFMAKDEVRSSFTVDVSKVKPPKPKNKKNTAR